MMNRIKTYIKGKDLFSKRSILVTAFVLCMIFGAICSVFTKPYPVFFGLIFGYVVSVLTFRLLEMTTKQIVEGDQGSAAKTAKTNYFIRLIIKGAAFYVSISRPDMSMLGCGFGLVCVAYAIHILNFTDILISKK